MFHSSITLFSDSHWSLESHEVAAEDGCVWWFPVSEEMEMGLNRFVESNTCYQYNTSKKWILRLWAWAFEVSKLFIVSSWRHISNVCAECRQDLEISFYNPSWLRVLPSSKGLFKCPTATQMWKNWSFPHKVHDSNSDLNTQFQIFQVKRTCLEWNKSLNIAFPKMAHPLRLISFQINMHPSD